MAISKKFFQTQNIAPSPGSLLVLLGFQLWKCDSTVGYYLPPKIIFFSLIYISEPLICRPRNSESEHDLLPKKLIFLTFLDYLQIMANAHFASRLRNALNSVWFWSRLKNRWPPRNFSVKAANFASHAKTENSTAATVLTIATIPSAYCGGGADCGGTFQFTENCVTPASQLRFVRV